MAREQRPMTYQELRDWVNTHEFGPDELDLGSLPWGVERWLIHEMLPAIRKTGHYDWPADLSVICPHTYPPLPTTRYVTDPVE